MKCEKVMYLMVLYLNGEIDGQDKQAFDNHLAGCQACKQELTHMQMVHQQLGIIPVPEPNTLKMQAGFYDMLNEYKRSTVRAHSNWLNEIKGKIREVWQPVYTVQLMLGIVLLVIGWVGGFLFRPEQNNNQQLTQLTIEVQQMRETMLLSMLEKPTATERLKAVSSTKNLEKVDEKVIRALLQTLNNDPNINVRLVTVEVLHQLANHPRVREGLIQSITTQESPLVQIALADIMVNLQEKRSVDQLQRLLKQKSLNNTVKTKIEESVRILL